MSHDLDHDPYSRWEYASSGEALLDARRILEDLAGRGLIGAADLRDSAARARQLVMAAIECHPDEQHLLDLLTDTRGVLQELEALPEAVAVTVLTADEARFLTLRADRMVVRCIRATGGR